MTDATHISEFRLLMEKIESLREELHEVKNAIKELAAEKREDLSKIYDRILESERKSADQIADLQARIAVLESARTAAWWLFGILFSSMVGVLVKILF